MPLAFAHRQCGGTADRCGERRSDGPLPIQRVPAALEINCWDESREWGSNKYVITGAGAVGAFVDVLNQMERTEAHRPLDMMEVDWNVFVAGNRGYICHLEIAPDAMRASGGGDIHQGL